MARDVKCSTESCQEEPVVEVFWPGKDPPPQYCLPCAANAKKILDAMGLSCPVRIIDG